MNHILIKYKDGRANIGKIESLDNLRNLSALEELEIPATNHEKPLFINFKGANKVIDYVQMQVEVYNRLRDEYSRTKKRDKKIVDLIYHVDKLIGNQEFSLD